MTQGELAAALQVSKRSVAAYESGAVLPFRHLDSLETAVSRPKAWLLYGDEALPRPNAILAKLEGALDEIVQRLDGLEEHVEQLRSGRTGSHLDGEARAGESAPLIDDLNRLVELRYQGMISEAEFRAAKALLVGLDRKKG